MNKANEPAFPEIYTDHETSETSDKVWSTTYSAGGLSKREYFAAAALGGFSGYVPEEAARLAIQYADALLTALEGKPKTEGEAS